MKSKLFELVFQRVENQSGSSTDRGKMKFLAEKLSDYGISGASDRNLLRYYNMYLKGEEGVQSPKIELLDALSQYLGYNSYEEFVLENTENETQSSGNQIVHQIGKNNIVIKENTGDINLS